jgi:hypothetical protein
MLNKTLRSIRQFFYRRRPVPGEARCFEFELDGHSYEAIQLKPFIPRIGIWAVIPSYDGLFKPDKLKEAVGISLSFWSKERTPKEGFIVRKADCDHIAARLDKLPVALAPYRLITYEILDDKSEYVRAFHNEDGRWVDSSCYANFSWEAEKYLLLCIAQQRLVK